MHIGELARRTGLTVKTVRYYSDLGLVPEAERTLSGYRRYDGAALVRLEFVRTLRELGLDLATVRRILERHSDLPAVAASHADALGAQIRLLRIQRSALRALARRQPTPKEVERMNRIAQATADERRHLIQEFVDSIFEDADIAPELAPQARQFHERMRSVTPELPDEPTDEQVDAWIELAELIREPTFRDKLREMGRRSFGGDSAVAPADSQRLATLVTEKAGAAHAAGIDPASAAATPVVDELAGAFAASGGRTDDPAYRRELLDQLELAIEPRAERYWQLMAIINGWPPIPATTHLWAWFVAALRARALPSA
jgi:DNA-binding transcriptional MerR regulator